MRAARARPQAGAVVCEGRSITHSELLSASACAARHLASSGVREGDIVAIELRPSIEFVQALHACWLLGAIAMPIDVRLTAAERDALCAQAALRITQPLPAEGAPRVAAAPRGEPPASRSSSVTPDAGESLLAQASHHLHEVAVILHTSGTTSTPKRVQLTFGNLLWSALGSAVALGGGGEERWLCTLPLCHVGGLSIIVRSAIFAGTAVIQPRFDAASALEAIMHDRITLMSVVATTLRRLLDQGLSHPPHLRAALVGGGPVPASLLSRAQQAGVPACATYGLTEASSQVATVPVAALSPARAALGARLTPARADLAALGAGPPLFCTKVQIAADGEILVAGPTVAPAALRRDGWLATGDLGHLDELGNLHVTGRKADTIVSGGENVAPAEVEALLEAHPLVAEAAVLGRPHPEWGEAVAAIVVPAEGASLTVEELRAHCAAKLAPFKVPKQFSFATEPLPRTASGKLLRRQLR